MSRKRIVIDLDAPAPAGNGPARTAVSRAKKPRRWTRVLGILAILGLVIAVAFAIAGFFVWRYYQSTPTYALSLMIDAAQRDDPAEFYKRLDDEAIAKNMAGAVSQKAAARYGIALSNSVKQQIDTSMPSLLQEIRPAIRDEVAKEIHDFAARSKRQPFIFLVIAVPSLMTITTQGDVATASARLNDRPFELAMRRGEDGWKVTDFKDDVVVQRVVDQVMTKLPAIGPLDWKLPTVKPAGRKRRR